MPKNLLRDFTLGVGAEGTGEQSCRIALEVGGEGVTDPEGFYPPPYHPSATGILESGPNHISVAQSVRTTCIPQYHIPTVLSSLDLFRVV